MTIQADTIAHDFAGLTDSSAAAQVVVSSLAKQSAMRIMRVGGAHGGLDSVPPFAVEHLCC